ncbi:ornithine racemase Orr [Petroclostridium sp. X23]|uniref:ornithine racemase Orr n=1 Tax=Petroclostridium sp. X23 TaxID=3045146 RepID=UPI0024ADC8FE|nr:ornithine racemase Orr [Petroclostridium sp. X23]WHH61240.1 ornithine racemase Orr [Petroclostridium sp. X23]
MRHPVLIIDKEKLKYNTKSILKMCKEVNIEVTAVTKACCGNPEIAEIFVDCGVRILADSKIENLERLSKFQVTKMLLRIPMLSEVEDVVRCADISLNSELKTMKALSDVAQKTGKKHNIILMIEMGDLREGILAEDALEYAERILRFEGINLLGVGTNLNCYGGIIPDEYNLSRLASVADSIEEAYGIQLQIVSGGNSGSLYLLRDKKMPSRVNHLRIGEAILRGIETSFHKKIGNLHSDVFSLRTEIVELKDKPSVPFGSAGFNAFGEKKNFMDKGILKRAIVACGRQDVLCEQIIPQDTGIEIIGASSDHLILNITCANRQYEVGDTIDFSLSYGALVAAFTSEYVHKVFF